MSTTTSNHPNLFDDRHFSQHRVAYIAVDVVFLILSVSKLATLIAPPHKCIDLRDFLFLFAFNGDICGCFTITTLVCCSALLLTDCLSFLLLRCIAVIVLKAEILLPLLLRSFLFSLRNGLLVLVGSTSYIINDVVLLLRYIPER